MTDQLAPKEMADQAKQLYQAGDYMQAAQAFSDIALVYAGMGDPIMSAEMKNNQAVALLRAGEAQAALDAVEGTPQTFTEAGDSRRQGMSLANRASALESLRRVGDALDSYKLAAEALEKAGEGDMRAEVMQLLSMLYLRRLKFYDAVLALQSGLAGVKNPSFKQRVMKKILFVRV